MDFVENIFKTNGWFDKYWINLRNVNMKAEKSILKSVYIFLTFETWKYFLYLDFHNWTDFFHSCSFWRQTLR